MSTQNPHQPVKIYAVGGCVRDIIIGRTPKDFDYVVCGATEQWMLDRGFVKINATSFPVFLDADGNEHALARKERKVAAGYNGFDVDFDTSVTLEDDLCRRDLTINAMAVLVDDWNDFVEGNHDLVVDPFSGRLDLDSRILRHVSDAFAEDPVRILRIARFSARYKFGIAFTTLSLMLKMVRDGEVDHLVPERVWSETERALVENDPIQFFSVLHTVEVLPVLFPDLTADSFMATNLEKSPCGALLRFALVCLSLAEEQVESLCEKLKVPTEFKQVAMRTQAVVNTLRTPLTAESAVKTLETVGAFQTRDNVKLALQAAKHSAYNTPQFVQQRKLLDQLVNAVTKVRFADLTNEEQLNLKGAEVGAALRNLRLKTAEKILAAE